MSSDKEMTPEKKGFDLTVTHRDEKTGLITHTTPYVLRVCGEQGSDQKARYWERPKGSGNLFDKHNNPIGRWITEEKVIKGKRVNAGKYDPDAAHIEWHPPMTVDQIIAQENAALKAELASLKAETEKKSAQAQKKTQGA